MRDHSSPHRGARRKRLGSASPPNDGMPSAIASHENRFLWCSPWRGHRARHALALHSSPSAAAAPFDAETSTDLTVLALSSHLLSRHRFGRRSCAPAVRERRDHRTHAHGPEGELCELCDRVRAPGSPAQGPRASVHLRGGRASSACTRVCPPHRVHSARMVSTHTPAHAKRAAGPAGWPSRRGALWRARGRRAAA